MTEPAVTAGSEPWLAMALQGPGQPLQQVWRQRLPQPGAGELAIRVAACGVCRTDPHIADGDLALPPHPVVPGHEFVGHVQALGVGGSGMVIGGRACAAAGPDALRIGLYGFGAAARLIAQVAAHQGRATPPQTQGSSKT